MTAVTTSKKKPSKHSGQKFAESRTPIKIGAFEVTSGKLVVSDPYYELGAWCTGNGLAAKKGAWKAYIVKSNQGQWGVRVAELIVHHKDVSLPADKAWRPEKYYVGVDSGQAGIYCQSEYRGGESGGDYGGGGWYDKNCKLTLNGGQAGTLERGCVASSGFGDGGYAAFAVMEAGKRVALKVVFIGEEEGFEDVYGEA